MVFGTNWLASTVSLTVRIGWTVASQIMVRQSPVRVALSLAGTLVRRGVKLQVDTWINKRQRRRRAKFFSGAKISLKKTFRWAKKKKRAPKVDTSVEADAGMRYKAMAERRLKVAQEALEAAAVELRTAEREMKEAETYVSRLRLQRQKETREYARNDVVFVEYADQIGQQVLRQSSEVVPNLHSVD